MRVLAVNWLDRENPQAGGAELHFFEIFRRLVARGHEITLVASGWTGAPHETVLYGIRVRRYAGRHTFALAGRRAVRSTLAAEPYDVVVEDINKLPLYLPTVTSLPVYVVVPHLFGSTAFAGAPLPVAAIVWVAERPIPVVYRRAAFHAISESTRDDLVRRGVPARSVQVIHPGVDTAWFTPGAPADRAPEPTFLYLGRLKRYKGIETALRAVQRVRGDVPDIRLEIAGQGDDRRRLEHLASELGLGQSVRFLGFVAEGEKRERLRRAWSFVFPSAKEGWGIANVEAAACGTPAIASDSPGLRESVRDGETGLLVRHGDPDALANAMRRIARDRDLVDAFGAAARRFAEGLSWDRAAEKTEAHLEHTLRSIR